MELRKKREAVSEEDIRNFALSCLGCKSKTAKAYKDLPKNPEEAFEKLEERDEEYGFKMGPAHVIAISDHDSLRKMIGYNDEPVDYGQNSRIKSITLNEENNMVKVVNERGEETLFDGEYFAFFISVIAEEIVNDSTDVMAQEEWPIIAKNGNFEIGLAPRIDADF